MCCHCMNRREFLGTTAAAFGATMVLPAMVSARGAASWQEGFWNPDSPCGMTTKPLRVQPMLMYRLPQKREMTSYKSWGGIQTPEAVSEECGRIATELDGIAKRAEFPIEVLPVLQVTSEDEAAKARAADADTVIVYPATGSGAMLRGCIPDHGGIVFVRHQSGPVYYWYEALSVNYLRKDGETADSDKRLSVHDVVVDDADELLWRLRALHAVKNFMGARVVALGGAAGKYAGEAPAVARDKFKFDIVEVSYDDFGKRIESALADAACMKRAEQWTDRYLALPGTALETDRSFVVNAFVLYGLFKDLMQEHQTQLFTIKECMSTILPLGRSQGHRREQPVLRDLPFAAGRARARQLEEAAQRGARLALDDGVRRLPARDWLRRPAHRRHMGEHLGDVKKKRNTEEETCVPELDEETRDFLKAGESSLAFWDNPIDDEVWNNA